MVGARSAAMAFNRVVDADIDGRNPRTESRHLPAGLLSRGFAWGFVALSTMVFLLAARQLNPLCFHLAPVALGGGLLLFLHQALHLVFPPGPGIRAGDRARRGLDRHARLARSAHPVAHRRRHVLDRRFRHHLRLPGLRIRFVRRPFSLPRRLGIAGALRVAQNAARRDDRLPAGAGLYAASRAC